jgi:PKD repeat protein
MEDGGLHHRLQGMERVMGLALALTLTLLALPAVAVGAPPVASFSVSPPSPLTFETITFTSTSTGDITAVAWDLDNDGFFDDGTDPSASRSFSTAGIYTVRLRVVGYGGSGEQAQLIRVVNRVPDASIAYFPAVPEAGDRVSFVSTSRDADSSIVSQLWDLDGDGVFDDGAGEVASQVFPSAGTFTVRLRVSDSDQAEVVATQLVQVFPKPTAFLSPFPVVRLAGSGTATGARIRRLTVHVPPGSRVQVRCRGGGCKRRRQTRLAPAGPAAQQRVMRFRRFERRLRARAVLEIFVTKPGTVGKYTRYVIRKRVAPRRKDLCILPGAKRPSRCPSQ